MVVVMIYTRPPIPVTKESLLLTVAQRLQSLTRALGCWLTNLEPGCFTTLSRAMPPSSRAQVRSKTKTLPADLGAVDERMRPLSYAGYHFPPEIIQHAIWLYLRFTLSFRDVEELLAERGIDVSYETIRRWVAVFGPMIARRLRAMRPKQHTTWHLDEMFVSEAFDAWRAAAGIAA
jgi:hypothetical protein